MSTFYIESKVGPSDELAVDPLITEGNPGE